MDKLRAFIHWLNNTTAGNKTVSWFLFLAVMALVLVFGVLPEWRA